MAKAPEPSPELRTEYSYEDFGRDFFEHAVTVERVEKAMANLTGNAVDFGPREAGPGVWPRFRPKAVFASRRSRAARAS